MWFFPPSLSFACVLVCASFFALIGCATPTGGSAIGTIREATVCDENGCPPNFQSVSKGWGPHQISLNLFSIPKMIKLAQALEVELPALRRTLTTDMRPCAETCTEIDRYKTQTILDVFPSEATEDDSCSRVFEAPVQALGEGSTSIFAGWDLAMVLEQSVLPGLAKECQKLGERCGVTSIQVAKSPEELRIRHIENSETGVDHMYIGLSSVVVTCGTTNGRESFDGALLSVELEVERECREPTKNECNPPVTSITQ